MAGPQVSPVDPFENISDQTKFGRAILDLKAQIEALAIPSVHIGKGVVVRANDDINNLTDNSRSTLDMRPDGGSPSQIVYDDLGFYDTDGDTTLLTIPLVVPAIQKVIVWGYVSFTGDAAFTGDRGIDISKNNFGNGSRPGLPEALGPAANANQRRFTVASAPMEVTDGDFFKLHATVTGAGSNTIDASEVTFGLTVVL